MPGQIFVTTDKEDCADAITLKTPKGKILNLGYRSAEKTFVCHVKLKIEQASQKKFAH